MVTYSHGAITSVCVVGGGDWIEECFDHFCVNEIWLDKFSSWQVTYLQSVGSDHLLVKLKVYLGIVDRLSMNNLGKRFFFKE